MYVESQLLLLDSLTSLYNSGGTYSLHFIFQSFSQYVTVVFPWWKLLTKSGEYRSFQVAGAEGIGRQARPLCRQGGRQSAPGSCCHDNSLQGRGLSLGDLRKPRVSFWFKDSCSLVRLHFCGRNRASPSEPLYSTDFMEVWFYFAGPVCLELRSNALSSSEVPLATAASAFFPNNTHGSTLVSR